MVGKLASGMNREVPASQEFMTLQELMTLTPAKSPVLKHRPCDPSAQQQALEVCEPSLPAPKEEAYTPTEPEAVIIATRERRRSKTATAPTVKIGMKEGVVHFDLKHENKRTGYIVLMDLLGIHDADALMGYLGALADYIPNRNGALDDQTLNFIIQFVVAMKPRDQAEGLLFTQMAVIHLATIRLAGHSNRETRVEVKESYQRSANKLARTYAAQMTTLKHYRSSGKQKIIVKHVTVNEGGRAIVGDVTHGVPGEGTPENLQATA